MSDRPLSVVVAGGGTAGHIEPALAVADAVRAADSTARITALGTRRGLETRLVPERGYPLELIPPVPLPRKPTPELLRLPARVRASVRRTREVLDATEADVIVGFGGYVALPAYLAAGRSRPGRVPIVVHEANAKAGIANKIGARRAVRVLAAVAGSGVHAPGRADADLVGIPVRESITTLDRAALSKQARVHFGLPDEGTVLLVFGGSQGARSLNEVVSSAAGPLTGSGISVLHAHGPKNTVEVPPDCGPGRYVAVPYLSRMDLAYAAADAAICRCGAMTVAEVSAVGLPAFYVPLPHGNGEQELNARPIVAAGGGVLVGDPMADPNRPLPGGRVLSTEYVESDLIDVLRDPDRLRAMSNAAATAGHRDAAAAVARIVLEVARNGRVR